MPTGSPNIGGQFKPCSRRTRRHTHRDAERQLDIPTHTYSTHGGRVGLNADLMPGQCYQLTSVAQTPTHAAISAYMQLHSNPVMSRDRYVITPPPSTVVWHSGSVSRPINEVTLRRTR